MLSYINYMYCYDQQYGTISLTPFGKNARANKKEKRANE
jgi:hypothetical protein